MSKLVSNKNDQSVRWWQKSLHRRHRKSRKEWLEREVFKRLQKSLGDGADVTCLDSSFQTRAAATGIARSTTVDNRVRLVMMMTLSDDDLEPRSPKTEGTRQPGTVALSRENIWAPEHRVCTEVSPGPWCSYVSRDTSLSKDLYRCAHLMQKFNACFCSCDV